MGQGEGEGQNGCQVLEVSILKSVQEGEETVLVSVDDEEELETVYDLLMDAMYDEDEDEE